MLTSVPQDSLMRTKLEAVIRFSVRIIMVKINNANDIITISVQILRKMASIQFIFNIII